MTQTTILTRQDLGTTQWSYYTVACSCGISSGPSFDKAVSESWAASHQNDHAEHPGYDLTRKRTHSAY